MCISTADTDKRKEAENMFQLDFGDHRPIYEQIREKIKELIISGVLGENDKIPSVRELAANLAINPNTIQKAYKELESEGYIYSRRNSGSFVSPQKEIAGKSDTGELFDRLDSVLRELIYCGEDYEKIKSHLDDAYKRING